jgi:hypothetical protein
MCSDKWSRFGGVCGSKNGSPVVISENDQTQFDHGAWNMRMDGHGGIHLLPLDLP